VQLLEELIDKQYEENMIYDIEVEAEHKRERAEDKKIIEDLNGKLSVAL